MICFVLQYGLIDVHFKEPEFGLTMSIPPALTIGIILGVYFVRKEHKPLMLLAIVSDSPIRPYEFSSFANRQRSAIWPLLHT